MQKYTKHLFIFSFLLSLASLYIIEKGGKEIYPFFSWKLFTSPSGNENQEQQYKIYAVVANDTLRLSCKSNGIYDENNVGLIVGFYGKRIEKNFQKRDDVRKIRIFIKSWHPEYHHLLLYKEIYNPRDLGKSSFTVTKKLISRL